MTEASENDFVVRVRAQVMCRDEGTGGWLALGGGGLADVMVGRKPHSPPAGESPAKSESSSPPAPGVPPPDESPPGPLYDYYISGRRIQDNMTVLECSIGRDFQYNKVMPTFHHWVTEHKRFGLTFQTAADARAFDKGVRIAIHDIIVDKKDKKEAQQKEDDGNLSMMLDGLGGAWPSLHAYKKLYPGPREEDEEQPIFECLNLPSESRSSSENSTASRAKRRPTELTQTPILRPYCPPSTCPRTHTHAQNPESNTLMGATTIRSRTQKRDVRMSIYQRCTSTLIRRRE
ncbi:WH1 domain-containing protein [Phthorimaea operculella]|nr:WH1 domain-containing protein [Phthorimaea operculella]